MWLLFVAVVLLGLKLGAIGPFATLSWWWISIPLGLAFLWWEIVDPWLGLSQKRAVREMDERRTARVDREREKLGLRSRRKR